MSKIKGKGVPTRKTAGAIGDIYIDTNTGRQYKCTNAYGVNSNYDYTWTPLKVEPVKVEQKPEPKAEKKAEKKVEAKVEEPVAEPTKEEAVEETETEEVEGKKRTNYSAAYNKKSK